MRRWTVRLLCWFVVVFAWASAPASAHHDFNESGTATAFVAGDDIMRMGLLFSLPNTTGAVNSDMAFWGDRAFVGNYDGVRIFDISKPASPALLADFKCFGPQNDVSVWDRDGNGDADLLITSVDRTLTGPQCGATAAAHDDPSGWEGLRLFDVSNPTAPVQIGSVYQDCGSHTHTLIPKPGSLRILNSSYPLRPGPTCGPVRGPEAGRDALHGVIQVVDVPLDDPAGAREVAELPISYPGDPDNTFTPSEQGLSAPGLIDGMRACHDTAVFVELGLVAGACAEQLQLWRIGAGGLPDTANPVWTYDQRNVDFWHSATFSWDGKVVNGIDESFGTGCPTTTLRPGGAVVESGNMFFLSTASGAKLSEFRFPRQARGDIGATYCSAHLGLPVPRPGRDLLVNAWYRGGVDVIDFSNPRKPFEAAWYTRDNADNWSAYPYETNPKAGSPLTIFGNSGVHAPATGHGFEVYSADLGGRRIGLDHLNPQTQERVIANARKTPGDAGATAARSALDQEGTGRVDQRAAERRLAP